MAHVAKRRTRCEAKFPAHYDLPCSKSEKVKTKVGTYTVNVFNVGKDWRGKAEYEYEVIYPDAEQYGTTTRKFSSVAEAMSNAVREISRGLAKAEAEAKAAKKPKSRKKDALDIAEERGWKFKWEAEQEDWASFVDPSVDDPANIEEVDSCVLFDEKNNVLESLGGIVFMQGNSTQENRNYAKSIEKELAEEALAKEEAANKLMRT